MCIYIKDRHIHTQVQIKTHIHICICAAGSRHPKMDTHMDDRKWEHQFQWEHQEKV